jgi:hypothetical protein
MTRHKNMCNHDEPLLVAINYVVSGPRTAAAVAAGKTKLVGRPTRQRMPRLSLSKRRAFRAYCKAWTTGRVYII